MTASKIPKEGLKVYLPEDEGTLTEDIKDVIGLVDAKEQLMNILKILQKENVKQLKEWTIEIGGKILIVGPFGMGKTSLIRALAKKEQLPLIELNVAELLVTVSNQIDLENEVKQALDRIHTIIKDIGACMILLDEFEPMNTFREDEIRRIRRAILSFVKEFNSFEDDVTRLLIAITSYPIKDEGMLKFFDHHITINGLSEKTRFNILRKYLEKADIDPSINLETFLGYYASEEITGGFSGDTLKKLVQGAAYKAMQAKRETITEKDLEAAYQQLKKTHSRLYTASTKTRKKHNGVENHGITQRLDALELEITRLKWMINSTTQVMLHSLRLAFSDNREFIVRFFEHFEKDQRPYELHEIAHISGMDVDVIKRILRKKHFAILFPKLKKRGRVVAFDRELMEKVADEFTFMRK